MNDSPIQWLHGQGTPASHRMGGKATRLARLARAGWPVPEGFCIGPEAFWQALARLDVTEHSAGDGACVEALRSVALGPQLEAAIADALRRMGNVAVSVRSSALDEDTDERSFAGQYRSILSVQGVEQVVAAIRDIWASWFGARAAAYRGAGGPAVPEPVAVPQPRRLIPVRISPRRRLRRLRNHRPIRPWSGGMAVLVQRMVDARTSGVLFTANPVTGARSEMTLEATAGLGEDLVSGIVHPDLWVLGCGGRARGVPVIEIRERTPAPDREQPLLDDARVEQLATLGLAVEAQLGGPQDIEWSLDEQGQPWLLQSRPITSLEQSMTRQRRSTLLWTQRFSGERWTEEASPLGWSVIQPVLHHFIEWELASRRYMQDAPPTMLFRGVPYFNITIFRHLVFRLPGMEPIQFMLEFFPPEEQEQLRQRSFYLPQMGLVASVMAQVISERRWRRYQFNVLTNHRVWDRFQPEMVRRVDALRVDSPTTAAGLRQYRLGRDLVTEYVEIHLLSLLFANLSYQLLGTSLRRWVGDHDHQLRAALTAAPGENRTVEGHKALWKLAGLAQQIPAVNVALLERPEMPSLEELSSLPDGRLFVEAVEGFLDEYGHRSAASWEIFATRWCEDPRIVLRMIAGYLQGGIHTDPYVNEERHREAFDAARQRLDQALHRSPLQRLLPFRRAASRGILELTCNYMRLRENQRFFFDQLLYRMKRILLGIGELLVQEGRLERAADIELLQIEEVYQLCEGRMSATEAAGRIVRRRETAERDRLADHPEFLTGDGVPVASEMDDRRMLHGMGISPGRVRGRVRVLRDLRESRKLERGDILVTRATDPGWTPLFLTAGGLVMELGSLLSHGAVVAREYALPAVVNVANATGRLKDGQEVALDGARGLIYIL